ncbi:unnamed protein product [Candida verbasci]|uniref:UDP-glucose:glycoprotein glucosyltransferase n=1 Tax=Candida verbasci TaxID=1227364 RepID=A0A9W4TVN7_9ASCO|nr:unnamed protein product [Candida verbasci]
MIIKLWFQLINCIILLGLAGAEKVSVELDTPWQEVEFVSNLIESIVGYDEKLHIPAIESIFGLNDDEIEYENNEEMFKDVLDSLNLKGAGRDFINFNFKSKIYSPRVITQFQYYDEEIIPKFEKRLLEECKTDSFGNEVETLHGKHQTWLLYNNKLYCSANDLFALQTDKSSEKTLPFDRIIGDNEKAPLLVLYGMPSTESTKEFFKILYQDSKAGKIRFTWRYIPNHTKKLDKLSGYGADLRLKDFEYLKAEETTSQFDLTKDFEKINKSNVLYGVEESNIKDLGIKFTSFILSNRYELSKLDLLTTISFNFPKFVHYITRIPKLLNYEKVKSKVEENESVGFSDESYGLYINGSPIHLVELDIFKLVNKIKEELNYVQNLISLGFNSFQSKLLLSKFALMSAVKQSQFRSGNTLMGNNENRFKVYTNVYDKSNKAGVVFFNNIEKDFTYTEFSTDRQDAYLGVNSYRLKPNQIPPLKENIHDLIFVLNFANKQQLRVFFTLSKIILDSGIPQQVGLLPIIGDDPMDKKLADTFYYITSKSDEKESLALLYKYYESKSQDEVDELLNLIDIKDFEIDYSSILERFSIESPSIIFNGVINDLTSKDWQLAMSKQISQDVNLIKSQLRQAPYDGKLKNLIYANAKEERNLKIVPLEPSEIVYKSIDRELIKNSIAFKNIDKEEGVSGTFWLVSNFNDESKIQQLIDLLRVLKKNPIQIRVLNYGNIDFAQLLRKSKLTTLTNSDIDSIIEILKKTSPSTNENTDIKTLLQNKQLPSHHSFILFNSRYFRLNNNLSIKELNQIIEYEFSQRLNIINEIINTYPDEFDLKLMHEFNSINSGIDAMDWFDLVSSIITKSFHVDDRLFILDVNRFDFSSLDMSLSIDVEKYDEKKPIDVLLINNPVTEYAQKTINLIQAIKDFSFVNVKILLQPKLETSVESISKRFYKIADGSDIVFDNLPPVPYSLDVDVPSRWVVNSKQVSNGVDLSDFRLAEDINVKFELQKLIVEGYARDIHSGKAPNELILKLYNNTWSTDTLVMTSLNYFQIQTLPGIYEISIANPNFELLSADENKYNSNNKAKTSEEIIVSNLDGMIIHPRVRKTEKSIETPEFITKHANINIFTIAGGFEYEKLVSMMIASVKKHNPKKSIKFWILDNFVSPDFKKLVPVLSNHFNVEIETITYKWPNFLRKPKDKQRLIWGYKILFLDVLFPQDLEKVIFIDADQICRTDLSGLVEFDLEGAPYGFTPMCDSNTEMDGFRFWKNGYWKDVLGDDLKYHISALFVIDLNKFRQINAGNRLRSHYQKLSSDPNSLSNLDQDLPNNMQRSIKIKSLPQEWLWCETWCSKDTLKEAKMIDLCNNPKTKENKLKVAKRLIPEWADYEKEILELIEISKLQQEQQEPIEEEIGEEVDPILDHDDDEEDYHDEL